MGTTTHNSTTPTMEKLIAFMREHGGKIHRHPGGFWSRKDWKYDGKHFGTPSVQALVRRGLATYTAEQPRQFGGAFPIEATLVSAADSLSESMAEGRTLPAGRTNPHGD